MPALDCPSAAARTILARTTTARSLTLLVHVQTSLAPPAPGGLPGVVSAPALGHYLGSFCAASPVGGLPIAHGKIS
jgi:hypothetical protein